MMIVQNRNLQTRQDFKEHAKNLLQGRWFEDGILIFLFMLPYLLVNTLYTGGFFTNLILLTITSPLVFGLTRNRLNAVRGKDGGVEDLLYYFKSGRLVPVVLLYLLATVKTFLFALLLIVPGIIVSFSYSLYMYLRVDFPDLDAKETLQLSSQMMKGYKMEYFILGLSFIGWAMLTSLIYSILASLSVFFGIVWFSIFSLFGFIIWIPLLIYTLTTFANFYEYVRISNKVTKNDSPNYERNSKTNVKENNSSDSEKKNNKVNIKIR